MSWSDSLTDPLVRWSFGGVRLPRRPFRRRRKPLVYGLARVLRHWHHSAFDSVLLPDADAHDTAVSVNASTAVTFDCRC